MLGEAQYSLLGLVSISSLILLQQGGGVFIVYRSALNGEAIKPVNNIIRQVEQLINGLSSNCDVNVRV